MLGDKKHRVAVVIESSNAYGRGLLEGILGYIRSHDPWVIFLPEHGRGAPPLEALASWRGEGIISRIETQPIADVIVGLREQQALSVIDVSAARLIEDIPFVETDDRAIARLAYEHFRERDFQHIGFVGDESFQWSKNRQAAFEEAVGEGQTLSVFQPGEGGAGEIMSEEDRLDAWLGGLPKPVGVFACHDVRGRQVIDACRRTNLSVPAEVAVLGVDDDAILCGLASPPLSSVIPDAVGAGRLAAEILAQSMEGDRPERSKWLLPPLGISTRQSTDVLAVDDPLVIAAIRFIRKQALRQIQVSDVVAVVGCSRRLLEQRFSRRVGRTIHDEITRVRFVRAEQLLKETKLPLAEIAHRCGFRHAEYFSAAFARRYGMSPNRWRKHL